MRKTRLTLGVCILTCYVLLPSLIHGCGGWDIGPTFTFDQQPEFPYADFIHGKLGIIQPGFARENLFVAYRYLSGQPLSEAEATSLLKPEPTNQRSWWDAQSDASKNWLDARAVVLKDKKADIQAFRDNVQYESFLNCTDDAFYNATLTLKDRAQKFGADSEGVRGWIDAQDKVFSNCHNGQNIPDEAPAAYPALLRADRTYQIAAAHFYAQNFDEAQARFTTIAADRSSPWHEIAPYLAARALIRKGTLAKDAPSAPDLQAASERLKAILADPSLKKWHGNAQKLLDFIDYRLHPVERTAELEKQLSRSGSAEGYNQRLTDYIFLIRNEKAVSQNPMTEWIRYMRQVYPGDYATERDRLNLMKTSFPEAKHNWEDDKSIPWMVAVLYTCSNYSDLPSELITKADAIKPSSPAYMSVHYGLLRLRLAVLAERDHAIRDLDSWLEQPLDQLPRSSRNRLLALRLPASRSYTEFVRFLPRKLLYFDPPKDMPSKNAEEWNNFFDPVGANYLNHVAPVSLLAKLSVDEKMPVSLRGNLAKAAFVRAFMLKNEKLSLEAARVLMREHPESVELIQPYIDAKTPDQRNFAAIYAILNYPGLTPFLNQEGTWYGSMQFLPNKVDDLSSNWWCYQKPSDDMPTEVPPFLSTAEIKQGQEEEAQMRDADVSANWLTKEALGWAKAHPDDPRVPRALHRAVRATRYGCTDKATGPLSKAAFDLLRKQYPKSEWAKKTPYWFGERN